MKTLRMLFENIDDLYAEQYGTIYLIFSMIECSQKSAEYFGEIISVLHQHVLYLIN